MTLRWDADGRLIQQAPPDTSRMSELRTRLTALQARFFHPLTDEQYAATVVELEQVQAEMRALLGSA